MPGQKNFIDVTAYNYQELVAGLSNKLTVDASSVRREAQPVNFGYAPQIHLRAAQGQPTEGGSVKLIATITDMGGGIGEVVWRVNGQTQGELAAPDIQAPPSVPNTVTLERTVHLAAGQKSIIDVTAHEYKGPAVGVSNPMTVDAFGVISELPLPRLFILAAGIDKYAMKDLKLNYAVSDAKAFVAAVTAIAGNLVEVIPRPALVDEDVTKSNLEKAFTDIASKARPEDVFVLFVSGHGKSIRGGYYFVPQDLDFKKSQSIPHDAIGPDWWETWLAKIEAQKTLLIFDTCESAAASGFVRGDALARQTVMEQLQHASGQNVIAGGRGAAYEGFEGHGILTAALLEVFRKAAGNPAEIEEVAVDGLTDYVTKRVPDISQKQYGIRQDPIRKLTGNNFPIGLKILPEGAPPECPDTDDFVIIREVLIGNEPLLPGFRVGVKMEGNRAAICRDRVKRGYVTEEMVARMR